MIQKRKGFTLVELLIVIVVIGILSAMMMLSSTEAVSSAKATSIVAGLRNMKTAALAYYTDNMSKIDNKEEGYVLNYDAENADSKMQKAIRAYLNNGDGITGYTIVSGTSKINNVDNSAAWFVKYTGIDVNAKAKLEAKNKSLGLLAKNEFDDTQTDEYYKATGGNDSNGTEVYLFVR